MNDITSFLSGYKTYIGIAASLVYAALISLGTVESEEMVWAVILAWTGFSLRAGISKSGPEE